MHLKLEYPRKWLSEFLRRINNETVVGSAQLQGVLTGINDDEAEKRERRRSKVLELQRRHHDIGSPATPDAPDDRCVAI